MKSPISKRSIVIAGHKTSVSLEDEFWNSLKEIAGERNMQQGLPIAEQVLIPALRMVYNQSAIIKVAEELAVSPSAAENALEKLPPAAIAVAAEHGLNEFVELATRQGPPQSN